MEKNNLLINPTFEQIQELLENDKSMHFIGLGGIGMSGLAKCLLELNYKVSGSDIKESPTTLSISCQGGSVFIGHKAQNIDNAGIIVISTAIKDDNPELKEALNKKLPILHRSQVFKPVNERIWKGFKANFRWFCGNSWQNNHIRHGGVDI
ncbi:MAG: Mur ligase domain-containing protein [Desulfomicrobium escambiense]|nr:Mur ligase domain-containing protein [Desulfomicrobium escambiense]